VFVTTAFTDVTDKVLGGLEGVTDDKQRFTQIEERRKQIVEHVRGGSPEVACTVASYFEGAQFYQIEQIEIRDVRLVYAPSAGIGNYGGEVDNWRGRGTPATSRSCAPTSARTASRPTSAPTTCLTNRGTTSRSPRQGAPGDFVLVAGYPGRTQRLKTAAEAQQAADWYYSRQIALYEEHIARARGARQGPPRPGDQVGGQAARPQELLQTSRGCATA
jgi:hypothetical protein